MSETSKEPLFYGKAHPELNDIAQGNHEYLSRLIGVKLAGEALEKVLAASDQGAQ